MAPGTSALFLSRIEADKVAPSRNWATGAFRASAPTSTCFVVKRTKRASDPVASRTQGLLASALRDDQGDTPRPGDCTGKRCMTRAFRVRGAGGGEHSAEVNLQLVPLHPQRVGLELAAARLEPLAGARVEAPLVEPAGHCGAVEACVLQRHVLMG